MSHLEVKKMKQGMSYSCKEKTIILNVFKYFRTEYPDKCVTEVVRCTAKATGCSEKSVFQFRKEEASAEGFKVPSTTKIRKNININSREMKYDHSVRQAIRNIIYELKYKNIVASLNTILKHVNSNTTLPNFSLMTLRRLLFDMGFSYEKNGNKSVLVEKPASKEVKKNAKKRSRKTNNPTKIENNEQENNASYKIEISEQCLVEQKYMPHMAQSQHEMMHVPPPHMAPPMILNPGMPPAHPMDMQLKLEMPLWMHHQEHPPPMNHVMKHQ